jgi:hypothetical protein
MLYLAAIGLRRAGRTNNQSKGDKQSHAIARHRRILPFFVFRQSDCRLKLEGWLAPATYATSPAPPTTPVATAMARVYDDDYSLLDETLSLHNTSLANCQWRRFRGIRHDGKPDGGDQSAK